MRESDLAALCGFVCVLGGLIDPLFFTCAGVFYAAALVCRAIERARDK